MLNGDDVMDFAIQAQPTATFVVSDMGCTIDECHFEDRCAAERYALKESHQRTIPICISQSNESGVRDVLAIAVMRRLFRIAQQAVYVNQQHATYTIASSEMAGGSRSMYHDLERAEWSALTAKHPNTHSHTTTPVYVIECRGEAGKRIVSAAYFGSIYRRVWDRE